MCLLGFLYLGLHIPFPCINFIDCELKPDMPLQSVCVCDVRWMSHPARHHSPAERYVGRIIRTRCQDGGRLLNSCPAKKKLETSYQMVRPLGNWRVVGQNKVVIIRIIPLYTMLFNISNKCYITSYHIIIYISFHFLQHFVLIQLRKSGGAN